MTFNLVNSKLIRDRDFCSHLKELENLRKEMKKTTELYKQQKEELRILRDENKRLNENEKKLLTDVDTLREKLAKCENSQPVHCDASSDSIPAIDANQTSSDDEIEILCEINSHSNQAANSSETAEINGTILDKESSSMSNSSVDVRFLAFREGETDQTSTDDEVIKSDKRAKRSNLFFVYFEFSFKIRSILIKYY